MEAETIKQILLGNPLYMGIAVLALWYFRREDTKKLDEVKETFTDCIEKVTQSVEKLNKTFAETSIVTAVHAKDLENGDKRFEKLENDNIQIRQHLHDIKNDMVTKEHLVMLIESNKK